MKRFLLIITVIAVVGMITLSSIWWSSLSKAHTTADVLNLAKPGVSALWLASQIDNRYKEGAFETFLVEDIDLHNRVMIPASSLIEANYEVWLFEGSNDAVVIVFGKAFGVQEVIASELVPLSVSKQWSYLKWKSLGLLE